MWAGEGHVGWWGPCRRERTRAAARERLGLGSCRSEFHILRTHQWKDARKIQQGLLQGLPQTRAQPAAEAHATTAQRPWGSLCSQLIAQGAFYLGTTSQVCSGPLRGSVLGIPAQGCLSQAAAGAVSMAYFFWAAETIPTIMTIAGRANPSGAEQKHATPCLWRVSLQG